MATFYAKYPVSGGGGGGGIATYATFSLFPASAPDGSAAIALDTDTLYIFNAGSMTWIPVASPSAVLNIGTIDTPSASANGAHISGNSLIMQSASASVPGLVNLTTQTLAGVKTFSSAPNLSSLTASLPLQLDASKNIISLGIDLSGAQATGTLAAGRFPALTGDVTTTAGSLATSLVATTNTTLTSLANLATVGTITSGTWNGTTLAINHGGTGQTTAPAAFNALSPITTTGDLIYSPSGATSQRLAIGSTGNVLTVSGGVPTWAPPATSGTVTSVGMTVPTFLSVSPSSITSSGTFAVTLSGTALPVANGGTGLTSGTSGGILGFTGTGTIASSALLAGNQLVIGGGAGATPTTLAAGTVGQVLVMGASNPGYGKVNLASSSAVTGTLPIANGGTGQATANPAFNALSPLTTKGDMLTYGTVNQRHAVPGDYGALIADSAQSDGWRSESYLQMQGRPGKNYIQYADFENGATTGWTLGNVTLTNALPSGVPTFGSGASGNLSLSAVSSGQLAGSFSLGYVSSAATTAGNFVASSALTIDIEDQAKVLGFKFYYSVPTNGTANFSGTSSNSYGIAIYDVTNSAWIIPAGVFNLVQSTGVGFATGTFQTPSNMTSFRFVVYNANATVGATTLYFDDFFCGPQITPLAPAMSDWQNDLTFTPNTFGTVTNQSIWYRRVGDSMQVRGSFNCGTPGAGSAGITLPLSINPAKFPSTVNGSYIGFVAINQASTSRNMFSTGDAGIVFYDGSTTNQVFISFNDGGNTFVKQNGSAISASGNNVTFDFTIPIAGWSSNSVSSADTDTRVVAAYVTAPSGTPSSSYQTLLFGTTNFDTSGSYAPGTGIYTVPVAGKYRVFVQLDYNGSVTAGANAYVTIQKNGVDYTQGTQSAGGNDEITPSASCIIDCKPGDTILAKSKFLGTITSPTWNSANSSMSIDRLSGPAVITATETVAAKYNSCGTTFTGATATVAVWTVKEFDTHNAYSGGTYTCPVSGFYEVSAFLLASSTTGVSAGDVIRMGLKKNGSSISSMGAVVTQVSTPSLPHTSFGTTMVQCNAGDTLQVEVSNGDSTFSTDNNSRDTWVSFERIK